jgi:hypothetical protein
MFLAGFVHMLSLGVVAHTPPNACALVTVAEVSAAVGQSVIGGATPVAGNDPTTASCSYVAGPLALMVQVSQLPTLAAAKKQFADDHAASRTAAVESGVGDGAFSAVSGTNSNGWEAIRGSRIVMIVVVGPGASAVSHDRMRGLMAAGLARE